MIHQHYLLDEMNWSRLPIESLWPLIRTRPELRLMLPQHCHQLEYAQLLWIAQNDPSGLSLLLTDHSCARKIDWIGLDVRDYQTYFYLLKVYDISDFSDINHEVISAGLEQIDYFFPKTAHLARFLFRLLDTDTGCILKFSNDLFAFDLFDLDALLQLKKVEYVTKRQLETLLDLFLKRVPVRLRKDPFKASSRFLEATAAYSLKLREFVAFCQVNSLFNQFPKYIEFAQRLLDEFAFTDELCEQWQRYERLLISKALLEKDINFFIQNFGLVTDYYMSYSPGPFHQQRLLDLFLSSTDFSHEISLILADYHEADIFEEETIIAAMNRSENLRAKLTELSESNPKLLRTISITPRPQVIKPQPILVPQLPHETNFESFLQTAEIILNQNEAFILPSFVVDMGGPLLDWIHQILKGMLQHSLMVDAHQPGLVRPAAFLPLKWFSVLGSLHGKLLQLNCQLPWSLDRDFVIDSVISGAQFKYDDEALALQIFNEAGFRLPCLVFELAAPVQLMNCYEEGVQVLASSQVSIDAYCAQVQEAFIAWKALAIESYQGSLAHFLRPELSEATLDRLLKPAFMVDLKALKASFRYHFDADIEAYRLKAAWESVLNSLSGAEVAQLLLFCTGQSGLMFNTLSIQVHFSISPSKRLPHAKTCSHDVFIYLPVDLISNSTALIAFLRTSLLTAIFNYDGFGHS